MPSKTPSTNPSQSQPHKTRKTKTESSPAKTHSSTSNSSEILVKKRISPQTWLKLLALTLVIIVLIGYLVWDVIFHGPLMSLLSNRDQLVEYINALGPFGPLLYILLQILQTIVAPIPGQIVGSVGGFLFGAWGILWTTIGTLIGCWIVFKLARRFGRPLLEKIFKKSAIDKFDFIINADRASLILFAIFLLPGFPDDIVCYIAGLTSLPIRRLMLLVAVGRFPVIVLTNFIGSDAGENLTLVAICIVLALIILGIAAWQRERILGLLKHSAKTDPEHPKPLKHDTKTDSESSKTPTTEPKQKSQN